LVPLPHDPGPHWGEVGIHGIARPKEWDAVATVEAPQLDGDEAAFVVLADGRVVLQSAQTGDLDPLVRALARELEPPFRAQAVRRDRALWAVAGTSIETIELRHDPGGSFVELTWDGRDRILRIDGVPSPDPAPELEQLGTARYGTYAVRVERLVGTTWELSVDPL
jgi:hypothetical protein